MKIYEVLVRENRWCRYLVKVDSDSETEILSHAVDWDLINVVNDEIAQLLDWEFQEEIEE